MNTNIYEHIISYLNRTTPYLNRTIFLHHSSEEIFNNYVTQYQGTLENSGIWIWKGFRREKDRNYTDLCLSSTVFSLTLAAFNVPELSYQNGSKVLSSKKTPIVTRLLRN